MGAHGWSAEASRMTKLKDKKAIVEEIISTAISLSAGLFHDDGCRQRQRREDESFHEWHVVVSPDTDDVCNSNGFEASPKEQRQGRSLSIPPNVSREVSPSLSPVVSPVTSPQLSPRGNHLGSPEMNVRQTQSPLETPILETASNAPGARPKIAWTHNRHVLDRFCIQVRPKDELGEDDPAGLYWLRIRWLPPTIRRKQGDPLLNLASTRRGDHHSPECSNCSWRAEMRYHNGMSERPCRSPNVLHTRVCRCCQLCLVDVWSASDRDEHLGCRCRTFGERVQRGAERVRGGHRADLLSIGTQRHAQHNSMQPSK